jgi:sugar phosphate isomerase/epimerase
MPTAIAAQLYTVRDFTKTPPDIAKTIKRLKNIGYDAVQLSALGQIETAELRRILDGEGVTCCATHEPWETVRDSPDQVIDRHKALDCRYTALGGMPRPYQTEAGYRAFATEASEAARRLRAGGISWAYHHHSFEFEKFGRKTAMDILFDTSDPALFLAEIDTYWVQHGGGDPAAWIRRLKGRVPLVHLKDMVVAEDHATAAKLMRDDAESEEAFAKRRDAARAKKPVMAEVGEGNLNWPAILDACNDAGVAWYIVEQDLCQRDPFESLAISLGNLRAMGLT